MDFKQLSSRMTVSGASIAALLAWAVPALAQGPGWTSTSTVKELIVTQSGGINVRLTPDLAGCVSASGMLVKQTKEGSGAQPAATDQVKVHYEGRLIDGKVFDSSIARGEPATFPLNGVIPCWTEGVQTMKVGGKAQFICPANLAYGAQGSPPTIPPQSTLVFDVELLDIVKPAAPPAPAPVAPPKK